MERLTRDEYVFVDAVVTYRQDINSASLIPQSILVTDVHDDDSHHYADDHVRNYRESAAITAADVQRVQKSKSTYRDCAPEEIKAQTRKMSQAATSDQQLKRMGEG